MKKILVICAGLTLGATAAYAGIDLSWDGCSGNAAAVGSKVLACDGSGFYQAFANFQPSVAVANYVGIQGQMDLQSEAGPLPAFWHFETGGANDGGLTLSPARGSTAACLTATQWGTTGGGASILTSYTIGPQPNRALFQFSIVRTGLPVATLAAGINQYAFTMNLDEGSSPDLGGCALPLAIVLNQIDCLSTTQQASVETQPGLRGMCIAVNNSTPATCAATPTKNRTWGSVKSLYR